MDNYVYMLHALNISLAFVCVVSNLKAKNIAGFTGWLAAFMFAVCYYGTIHGLIK